MRLVPGEDFELVDDHFLSRLIRDGDDLYGDLLLHLLVSRQADASGGAASQFPRHVELLLQLGDLSDLAERAQLSHCLLFRDLSRIYGADDRPL